MEMLFNSEGKLDWGLFRITLNSCECLWFINFRLYTFDSLNSQSNRSEIFFTSYVSCINFDLINIFLFCLFILFKWRNIICIDFNIIVCLVCTQWTNYLILLLLLWRRKSIISVGLIDLVSWFILLNWNNRRWFDCICICDWEVRGVCFNLWNRWILIHLGLDWRFLIIWKIIKLWVRLNSWLIKLFGRLIRW